MVKIIRIWLISSVFLLSACATVPRGELNETVKTAPLNDIQLAEVKADVQAYMDTVVRWGGKVISSEVIKTDQGAEFIRLEILQRGLDDKAKPVNSKNSDGRFVAYIPRPIKKIGSLKSHLVTVVGKISNTEQMQINKNNTVTLPVLQSQDYYVWHQTEHYHRDSHVHFGILLGSPFFGFDYHHYPYRFHYHPHRHRPHGPHRRH